MDFSEIILLPSVFERLASFLLTREYVELRILSKQFRIVIDNCSDIIKDILLRGLCDPDSFPRILDTDPFYLYLKCIISMGQPIILPDLTNIKKEMNDFSQSIFGILRHRRICTLILLDENTCKIHEYGYFIPDYFEYHDEAENLLVISDYHWNYIGICSNIITIFLLFCNSDIYILQDRMDSERDAKLWNNHVYTRFLNPNEQLYNKFILFDFYLDYTEKELYSRYFGDILLEENIGKLVWLQRRILRFGTDKPIDVIKIGNEYVLGKKRYRVYLNFKSKKYRIERKD